MRIGMLSQWYDPEEGPAALPGVMARGLRDAGHDVVVLTGFPNYPSGRLFDGYVQKLHSITDMGGVEVHRVPLYPSHDRSALRRAANYTSFAVAAAAAAVPVLRDVDVVWVYNSPITVSAPAGVLRVISGVPSVLHLQDLWPDSVVASGLLPPGRVGRAAERAIATCASLTYKAAAEIAVISPGMRGLLQARGVVGDKIHLVPNCANEEIFRPVEYDQSLADEIGAVGRFTLMYGGSLGDVQSLDTAVLAAALLRDRPEFRLLLVGSGVADVSLRQLVAELELENVTFLGRRPAADMPCLMQVCDAQLVSLRDRPFLSSTMPSKIQSVLASGRPVVVAAGGDAADVVRKAGAGVTCPAEDPAALAAAIRQLLDLSPEELAVMGRRGRDYYVAELSAARLSQRIESLCELAIKRHIPRRGDRARRRVPAEIL